MRYCRGVTVESVSTKDLLPIAEFSTMGRRQYGVTRLSLNAKKELQESINAVGVFAAIIVANVGGKYYLLDGYARTKIVDPQAFTAKANGVTLTALVYDCETITDALYLFCSYHTAYSVVCENFLLEKCEECGAPYSRAYFHKRIFIDGKTDDEIIEQLNKFTYMVM